MYICICILCTRDNTFIFTITILFLSLSRHNTINKHSIQKLTHTHSSKKG